MVKILWFNRAEGGYNGVGFVGVGGRHGKSNLKRRHPTTNAAIWDFFPCLTILNHCTDSIASLHFLLPFANLGIGSRLVMQKFKITLANRCTVFVHDDEIQKILAFILNNLRSSQRKTLFYSLQKSKMVTSWRLARAVKACCMIRNT